MTQPIPTKGINHIYWFAYFNDSEPSVRFRAKYPLEILRKEHGITSQIITPGYSPIAIMRFVRVVASIMWKRKNNSVIVYEKIRTRRVYARVLKALVKITPSKSFYDIDDADYIKYPSQTIDYFLKNCTRCTAGSSELARYATVFNTSVSLLTSPVIDHPFLKSRRADVFTIGWVGYYRAHRASLITLLFPAIAQLGFPVRLTLLGVVYEEHFREITSYFAAHTHVTLHLPKDLDWQNDLDIFRRIAEFDVGVAPMLDTEVNRAKSAFKLKQYMSCGIPVLASNVGENATFLQHGVNGYFCYSATEFRQRLSEISEMNENNYSLLCKNAGDSRSAFSMNAYCTNLMHLFAEA